MRSTVSREQEKEREEDETDDGRGKERKKNIFAPLAVVDRRLPPFYQLLLLLPFRCALYVFYFSHYKTQHPYFLLPWREKERQRRREREREF